MAHPLIHPHNVSQINGHNRFDKVETRAFHFSTNGSSNMAYTLIAANGALILYGDIDNTVFRTSYGPIDSLAWASRSNDFAYLLSKSGFQKSYSPEQTAENLKESFPEVSPPDSYDISTPENVSQWFDQNDIDCSEWYEYLCYDYSPMAYCSAHALTVGAEKMLDLIDHEQFNENPYAWADELLFMDNMPLVKEWTALAICHNHRVEYALARRVADLFLKSLHWNYPSKKYERTQTGCADLVNRNYHVISDIRRALVK